MKRSTIALLIVLAVMIFVPIIGIKIISNLSPEAKIKSLKELLDYKEDSDAPVRYLVIDNTDNDSIDTCIFISTRDKKDTRQGIVFAIAGDQVHMEVRDALTGCLMDVADDVHAGRAGLLHDAHRQHAGRLHQVRQRLIIAGQKAVAVLLRDDERMAAGDLGNVQERHDLIIFIDDG